MILLPQVRDKLESLAAVLFDEGYFAIQKNALTYVDAFYNFIYTIPKRQRYATKSKRYGEWFCRYKPNKHTIHLAQVCKTLAHVSRHVPAYYFSSNNMKAGNK